jgi:hypothetical protein
MNMDRRDLGISWLSARRDSALTALGVEALVGSGYHRPHLGSADSAGVAGMQASRFSTGCAAFLDDRVTIRSVHDPFEVRLCVFVSGDE